MSHDPFLSIVPYVSPPLPKSSRPKSKHHPDASVGDFSIDALVSNRRRILQVKFEVFASLIKKRLNIRERNLDNLLENELTLSSSRHESPAYMVTQIGRYRVSSLPSSFSLEQALLKIDEQRRDEERGCLNEVIPVVRDLLSTWEALEQAKARAIFLKSYPNDFDNRDDSRGGKDGQ